MDRNIKSIKDDICELIGEAYGIGYNITGIKSDIQASIKDAGMMTVAIDVTYNIPEELSAGDYKH